MKRISILSALWLALACALPLGAQVKGVVVDVNGEPLIGVNVIEEATSVGTITDFDGNFELDVAVPAVLQISYIGYDAITVTADGSAALHITMHESTEVLEEVVVVGYGVQKKSDLTGSIAQVSEKDLQKLPSPSLGAALEGRAAGLQVTGSGAPGSNVSLAIRGMGSINNSNPLIVIDGVPTDVPLNMINMDDVASVDVLKDASATAIYGSRGAYGVVIITTKKGEKERGNLALKASFGFDQIQRTLPLLKAYQFASLHNEMMAGAGQPQNLAFTDPTQLGEGTDWTSELYQFAPTQNYALSYSGGTKKSNFYVSGAYFNQKGIVKTTSYERITLQFNHDTELLDWLRFGHKLSLNHDVKQSGDYNILNTMIALPTQAIKNEDGTWAGPVGLAMYVGDVANPIGKMMENRSKTSGYNLLGNIYAEIKPLDCLTFKSTFGMQVMYWDTNKWTPKYDWAPIAQPESEAFRSFDKSVTWLWDNTLTYMETFQEKHSLTAMIGESMQANTYEFMSGSIQGFISESAQQLSNGTLDPVLAGNKSDWSLLSFMARVSYGYDNRYLITATCRADGSSRFAKQNRWGVFPSAAVAWRMSEEPWFTKSFAVSDLKLRAGYGLTGNQAAVGNYAYASQLQTVQYSFGGKQVAGLAPWVLPNPNVRWETVEQYNVGVDLALLDQRLFANIDGYIKNTNDMLVPMSVPVTSGYSDEAVPNINAGKMRNMGVEVALKSLNFKGNFEWTTSVNFAYNHNKILSLNGDVPMYFGNNIHAVGYALSSFY